MICRLRMRTRAGMAVAHAKGKLHGKKPKLSDRKQNELQRMHDTGEYSISDLGENGGAKSVHGSGGLVLLRAA